MQIKKLSEHTVYESKTIDHVIKINDKKVRVREFQTSDTDHIQIIEPYEINEDDLESLSDAEY